MIRDTVRVRLMNLRGEHLVDALFEFMNEFGHSRYDETVTQLEHALQAGQLARAESSEPTMVTSALLHDLGHFLLDEHEASGHFLETDLCHETVGAEFLQEFFPEEVCAPIQLHVPAKRYLCTTDDAYFNRLSEASKRSFELQGGRLSAEERKSMEQSPFLNAALRLRRWDDKSKCQNLPTPKLREFGSDVLACLRKEFR